MNNICAICNKKYTLYVSNGTMCLDCYSDFINDTIGGYMSAVLNRLEDFVESRSDFPPLTVLVQELSPIYKTELSQGQVFTTPRGLNLELMVSELFYNVAGQRIKTLQQGKRIEVIITDIKRNEIARLVCVGDLR